jgi:septum formation topological specificity factor MinE
MEKVKHEKRIERLQEIRDELLAMIAKHGVVSLSTLSVNQTRNANQSQSE